MRVGIGLPAAVPATDMTLMGPWAAEAERAGGLLRLADAGCADALLFPCSGDLEQLSLLAKALPAADLASQRTNA